MKNTVLAATAIVALSFTQGVFADVQPHQHGSGDDRIAHFHYAVNEVYTVDLVFNFITQIKFERGEIVQNIQLGDSSSFQVTRLQSGGAITVKPLESNAATNMNVETNKRSYSFHLLAQSDSAQQVDGVNFVIGFKYPNSERPQATFVDKTSGTRISGVNINNDYQISGNADFAPHSVFDDGVNTYIRYNRTARRPAVFKTDSQGRDSVVNFTAHPNHLIQLHGLSNFWTLRIDGELVCIRKENASY